LIKLIHIILLFALGYQLNTIIYRTLYLTLQQDVLGVSLGCFLK